MIVSSTVKDQEALARLREALTELVARDLLSGLSLQGRAIKIKERPGTGTMATDGRALFYDPNWLKGRRVEDNAFDLLHEWLHIFGNHVQRRGDRDAKLWNIAADMVVVHQASELFSEPRWPYPTDGVIPEPWSVGKSVEQIYDVLNTVQNPPPPPGEPPPPPPSHTDSGGQTTEIKVPDLSQQDVDLLDAPALSADQEQAFFSDFVQEVMQAKTVMENAGRKLKPFIRERIVTLQGDSTPWERLIAGDIIADFGFDAPTFAPPNRRYLPITLLPSYRSTTTKILMVAVDVSASVRDACLNRFGSSLRGAVARAEETILVSFDAHIRSERRVRSVRDITKFRFGSGAHSCTRTEDVFARAAVLKPSSLVILTDLYVSFPNQPHHKTIWVTPEQSPDAPWGRHYRMKTAW